ncbi:MAG: hypothetical protein WA751_06730, partial [Candidatus Dormiibacterota bacterium]
MVAAGLTFALPALDDGSTAAVMAAASAPAACSAVSAQAGAASGGASGSLTVTAAGTCPSGSSPKYSYFVGPTASGPWTLTAAWIGPSWTTSPAEAEYAVVWVSDGPYTVPQSQTIVALPFSAPAACSAVSALTAPVGSASLGSSVTVAATSTCASTSEVRYSYFVAPTGSGPWTLEAAWIGPSWTWATVGEAPGSYTVLVWASDGPYTVPQVQSSVVIILTTSPLSNPSANVSPDYGAICYDDGYQSAECLQAEVIDIDSGLAGEGLDPLTWPAALDNLPPAQLEFIVTNEERVLRGLAPIVGMDTAADQNALTGAQAAEDPPIQ